MVAVCDENVRYRGSPRAVTAEILIGALGYLKVQKPLVGWLPSGGVIRDKSKAAAWAKWYCDFQQSEFLADPVHNCRLTLIVLVDAVQENLNLLFRIAPMAGEGSVGYRSFVCRTGEDEYACFEY
jgi:hypothetical protein